MLIDKLLLGWPAHRHAAMAVLRAAWRMPPRTPANATFLAPRRLMQHISHAAMPGRLSVMRWLFLDAAIRGEL